MLIGQIENRVKSELCKRKSTREMDFGHQGLFNCASFGRVPARLDTVGYNVLLPRVQKPAKMEVNA